MRARVAIALLFALAAILPGGFERDATSNTARPVRTTVNPTDARKVRAFFESIDALYAALSASSVALAQAAPPQSFNDLLLKTIGVRVTDEVRIAPTKEIQTGRATFPRPARLGSLGTTPQSSRQS
jgi:hypothetical protein